MLVTPTSEPRIVPASLTSSTFGNGMTLPIGSDGLFDWGHYGRGPDARGILSSLDKQAMLGDAQVSAALRIRRGTVLYEGVMLKPDSAYGESDFKDAVANAEMCKWGLNEIDSGLIPTLTQSVEADWWNNTVGDVNYEEKTYDGKKQVVVPGVIDVRSTGYILHRKNGRIVGVQPFVDGVAATKDGKPVVYDARDGKYLINLFLPDTRGRWWGTDLATATWTPFYKKNKGHPLELLYMGLFSSPAIVGTAPEDANQEVELLGPNGMPLKDSNGEVVKVSPQRAMSAGITNFGGPGSGIVIPPKSKLAYLEAQGDGRIFTNFFDGADWQIMTSILGTGNMTGRAKYGSNASAQTGQETVETPAIVEATRLAAGIQNICRVICERNAKKSARHLVPRVRLIDPRRTYLEKLFLTMMANSEAANDARFVGEFCDRLGVPKPDFDSLKEMQEQRQTQPDNQGAQIV